jgi:hypothetical protein
MKQESFKLDLGGAIVQKRERQSSRRWKKLRRS